jgi:hypothetical protein
MSDDDPNDEIERLEAEIDELAAKIESCRKFILAARIAIALGGITLVAMLFGVVRPDLGAMTLAMAAVLVGIVVAGANGSTAREATEQMSSAEAKRSALIGQMELQLVSEHRSLH